MTEKTFAVYYFLRVDDKTVRVEITIDTEKIAKLLGTKAMQRRSRKATAQDGAIVVTASYTKE